MKLLRDKKGYSNLVPMVLVVIIAFVMLFIGVYINGVIHEELNDSITYTNQSEGDTLATMNNTSENWDSTLDIVQVVVIITVLAMAIGAIFLFTRFR